MSSSQSSPSIGEGRINQKLRTRQALDEDEIKRRKRG
jgi:hypothetical protein